ncbi:hypothetical protein BOO92_18435 [Vibrio navarrensis]|uniref:hypothetical protein n=1 Tax=Vibrio navarrensis TaxID=29495 RepID=UPI001866228B|nr:hypothetical protein [Vibrio navarrensis]MBE3658651.1 hypothetical protein [Vibrio navarrensis]
MEFNQIYEHGFIDKKAILPADYCELGVRQFEQDLATFSAFKSDIVKSLESKISELGNIDLVLPSSLHYLVRK